MSVDRRQLLAGAAATALTSGRVGGGAALAYDAVVLQPGAAGPAGRRFGSLGAALTAATGARPFRIWLGRGEWREKLTVTRPGVSLIGEDRTGTVLRFDAAAGLTGPSGSPWGTAGSATLTVLAPDFNAERLTIVNGFDPRTTPVATDGRSPLGEQAVALLLAGASDRAGLREVDLLSRQDTLFVDAGRALFDGCLVAGTVDFVFGGGAALFRNCEVRSRLRAGGASGGFVAAPSTPVDRVVGLVFDRCRLTREPGVADRSIYLGRPWRPTRSFPDGRRGDPDAVGMAAFLDCRMEAHIAEAGWTSMGYNGPAGRATLEPEQARFGERGSFGPGASGIRRGATLTADDAARLRSAFA